MSGQVKRVVQACHSCAIVKSRRNLAHGQFASVQVGGPRSTFAIDFYEVAESADGHKYVLTVIDLFFFCFFFFFLVGTFLQGF